MLNRIRSAFKNVVAIVFQRFNPPRWTSGYYSGGFRLPYGEVHPELNSIVTAVVGWMARNFPEAPPRVRVKRGGELVEIEDHPLTALLRRPNFFYSGALLWIATISSWLLTGNAYWIKVRSGAGRPVELWWIPSNLIYPDVDAGSDAFITHYSYRPDGRAIPIRYEVSDVVHFRYGLDPENPRLGLTPFKPLLRDIFTDDEAATFSAVVLKNLGVPGVIVSPDADDMEITPEGAASIKSQFQADYGGENRGKTVVLNGKSKVQVVSFSPEQMNLKDMRRVPEERVSAVLGIPAIVAGLGAGLDRATYSNMAQAREAAYENGVIPAQRLFAEDLRVQLLPDFADITKTEIDFDLSNVRVLQDDQNKLVDRLTKSLLAGGMTLNQYMLGIGKDALPGKDGDILYVPKSVVPMRPDQLLATQPQPVTPGTQSAPFTVPAPAPGAPSTNGKVPVAA